MTLKNLYLTDILENLKRRSWIFWGSFLVFFCTYPGFLLLNLNRLKNNTNGLQNTNLKNMINVVETLFSENAVIICLVVLLGILFGIQGYTYLHDKKQVNFYHSQPVTRDRRFLVIWTNGIGIFLVTYGINLVLGMIVAAGYGCFFPTIVSMAVKALLLYFLVFLAISHLSMIAVILTGNTLVALLVTGVFLCYEVAFRGIWLLYEDSFFLTYRNSGNEMLESISSPIMKVWGFFQYSYSRYPWEKGLFPYGKTIAAVAAQALAFGVIAWLLFRKRPSEGYGKSISFSVIKEPVRLLLLVLSGLCGALLFYSVAGESMVFGILGAIFTVFLGHVIIQLIYEVDFGAVRRKMKSPLLSLIITLGVCGFFYFDPMGMEARLPRKSSVESVGILLPGGTTGQNQWIMENGQEIWGEHYAENMMHLTQLDIVYQALQQAEDVKEIRNRKETDTFETYNSIDVTFYKKNGKKVRKDLYFQQDKIGEIFASIYKMEEYQTITDQTATTDFIEKYRIEEAEYYNGINTFSLEKDKVEALHQAYRQDVANADYQEMFYQIPVGKLTFLGIGLKNPDYNNTWEVLVFEGFSETISLLEEYEVPWKAEFNEDLLEQVEYLAVSYTDYELREEVAGQESYTKTVHYGNKEEIKKLLEKAIPRENTYWSRGTTPFNTGTEFEISITRNVPEEDREEFFGSGYEGSARVVIEIYYRNDEIPKIFNTDLQNTDFGETTKK